MEQAGLGTAQRQQVSDGVIRTQHARGVDIQQTRTVVAPQEPEVVMSAPGTTSGLLYPEIASPLPWRPFPASTYDVTKRMFDIVVSLIGLAIAIPIMLVVAAVVRLDSPGPIIFRQQRVGKNGKLFTFYKFRTMYADARQRFPELYAYQYTDTEIKTMYFKVLHDPRLTRFGRHLRKTSIDELPNLLNVLRGDMTMVGPRPEIPEMLPYYTPEQMVKFTVKPGVTGLAQVTGRSVLRFQETIARDIEYCRIRSFWTDIVILLRTFKTVILRVGAF